MFSQPLVPRILMIPPAPCLPAKAFEFDQDVSLDDTERDVRRVIEGDAGDVLPILLDMGGSPQGACPKITVGFDGTKLTSRTNDLPAGFESWIIKFLAKNDELDAGLIEYCYAQVAKAAGINVPRIHLFETRSGGCYFGIKRFDRDGDNRLHMHTYGNLIHTDFRVPDQDYEQLLKVTGHLTKDLRYVEEAFRLMVFNVVMHNRDDHAKNFTYLMSNIGEWSLAPAYDLTYSLGTNGWHATTILEEGLNPTVALCLTLAAKVGIGDRYAREICEQVVEASSTWTSMARSVGISAARIAPIERAIIRV